MNSSNLGFHSIKSYPNWNETLSNLRPTGFKFKPFKNWNILDEIAKGGEVSNPVPNCGACSAWNSPERATGRSDRRARVLLCADEQELELNLPFDTMGLRRVLEVEQGRLFQRERERALGWFAVILGSGKVMRKRGSFGSWKATLLNGNNSKLRQYRKLCNFKKMLSH